MGDQGLLHGEGAKAVTICQTTCKHVLFWHECKCTSVYSLVLPAQVSNQGLPTNNLKANGTLELTRGFWLWSWDREVEYLLNCSGCLQSFGVLSYRGKVRIMHCWVMTVLDMLQQSGGRKTCHVTLRTLTQSGGTNISWSGSLSWCTSRLFNGHPLCCVLWLSRLNSVGSARSMIGMTGKCDTSYVWPSKMLSRNKTPHWWLCTLLLVCAHNMHWPLPHPSWARPYTCSLWRGSYGKSWGWTSL